MKSYLKENIRSILALMILVLGFAILYIALYKPVRANDTLTNQIVTGVQGLMMFAMSYFFSASKPQTESGTSTTNTQTTKIETTGPKAKEDLQ
jgi:hypothetical protein